MLLVYTKVTNVLPHQNCHDHQIRSQDATQHIPLTSHKPEIQSMKQSMLMILFSTLECFQLFIIYYFCSNMGSGNVQRLNLCTFPCTITLQYPELSVVFGGCSIPPAVQCCIMQNGFYCLWTAAAFPWDTKLALTANRLQELHNKKHFKSHFGLRSHFIICFFHTDSVGLKLHGDSGIRRLIHDDILQYWEGGFVVLGP